LGAVTHLSGVGTATNQAKAACGIEPLLGVADLSALIGVPVATIYDWRTRGLGPVGHRLGKHVKFAPRDVAAWIESRREQTPTSQGGGAQ
jgi:predicted DNA-binding transcriptional regulator AlpA